MTTTDAQLTAHITAALNHLRETIKWAQDAGLSVRVRGDLTFNHDIDPRTLAAVVSRTY